MGVIDVSGPAFTLHPAIEMLVEATRRSAEARILRRHADSLNELRRCVEPLLVGVRGPVVVIDDDGWVAVSRGVRLKSRLSVPIEGRFVEVPGLGRVRHSGWSAAGCCCRRSTNAPRRTCT